MKYCGIYFNLHKGLGLFGNVSVYAIALCDSTGDHLDPVLFLWLLCSYYAQELFKMRSQFPGVLPAAAERSVGNVKEFSVTLWLLLSAGRAARRAGGKWLPDCFLSSCSVQGSHATPLAPRPSRTPGMDRAGHLCHFHTSRGGGEWSQHSLCKAVND